MNPEKNGPDNSEAPVSISDLLMEAKEWEAACARQPVHDICEACSEAHLLKNAAKSIEHWMRQALRYKHAADFLWNEVMERSTFGEDEHAQIPDHDCGYIYRPDGGACDWHEQFVQVADYLGHVDEWAEEAMADAE